VVQDLALLGAGALVPGAALGFLGHHSHNLGTNVHKGYPRGLSSSSIGLDTRILTVCDV
jgi:response regulator RpfG family c-di-GMP phosphodiesterase